MIWLAGVTVANYRWRIDYEMNGTKFHDEGRDWLALEKQGGTGRITSRLMVPAAAQPLAKKGGARLESRSYDGIRVACWEGSRFAAMQVCRLFNRRLPGTTQRVEPTEGVEKFWLTKACRKNALDERPYIRPVPGAAC